MSSYCVTAIGTDVGKTFVSAALLYGARQQGIVATGYKPVACGGEHAAAGDVAELHAACGRGLDSSLQNDVILRDALEASAQDLLDPVLTIFAKAKIAPQDDGLEASPWWFAAPLSPHMAAAAEGKVIDVDALQQWCRARIRPDGLTLFEGVGGVMVPLTVEYTVRDWMAALDLPVILVASNYLGAINHTLLTLEALRAANLKIAAIIISESVGGVSLGDTESTIRRFAPDVSLIVSQSRVASWQDARAIHAIAPNLV
jgi:dethiobiotin synthetase